MVERNDILNIFRETNTFYENGHFKLESGMHSDAYIQVRETLLNRNIAKKFGKLISNIFKDDKVNKVLGYNVGSYSLACETADFLNASVVLAGKRRNTLVLSNGDKLNKEDKVLIVDDILTTKSKIIPVINGVIKQTGVKPIGIGLVVDRRLDKTDIKGVKVSSLLELDLNLWKPIPEDCPLCRELKPLVDFSTPDENPFSILESVPEDIRDKLLSLYKEIYNKLGRSKLEEAIRTYDNPINELPGKKYERVAVLGSFDCVSTMENIAKIVSKLGYYAITSRFIYRKRTGKRIKWQPYNYEHMNDFLGRMLFSCQYAIIDYMRAGGQFMETYWCNQSNKPTLGMVFLRPWIIKEKCKCDFYYGKYKPNWVLCNGFNAFKLGMKKVGGFICDEEKGCPFVKSDLTKMILDLYSTSATMHLIGLDPGYEFSGVIKNFLNNHGNLHL